MKVCASRTRRSKSFQLEGPSAMRTVPRLSIWLFALAVLASVVSVGLFLSPGMQSARESPGGVPGGDIDPGVGLGGDPGGGIDPGGGLDPGTNPLPGSVTPEFINACKKSVDAWQRGVTTYPRTLSISYEDKTTYDAGIDLTGMGGLSDQFNPAGTYTNVPTDVRCGLGARLVSLSDGLDITPTNWILHQFDDPGVVRWSWTVAARKAKDGEVRLELRPAVAVSGGG